MEPTSTALGVVGLLGVFTTCMQCFDYVQYARTFGADYESAILKLDVSRLRLARWAQSIGLSDNLQAQRTPLATLRERDVKIAESLLGSIKEAFDSVEGYSKRYEERRKLKGELEEDEGVDSDDDRLSARLKRMHVKTKSRIAARQQTTSKRDKAKWALCEKKKFDDLVSDIKDHTDSLVNLFPQGLLVQRQLAAEEVAYIAEDAQGRLLLKAASQDTDFVLGDAVEQAIIVNDGHHFSNVRVAGHAKAFLGNDVAYGVKVKGNTYHALVIDGDTEVHAGNVFRAKGQKQVEFGRDIRRSNSELPPTLVRNGQFS